MAGRAFYAPRAGPGAGDVTSPRRSPRSVAVARRRRHAVAAGRGRATGLARCAVVTVLYTEPASPGTWIEVRCSRRSAAGTFGADLAVVRRHGDRLLRPGRRQRRQRRSVSSNKGGILPVGAGRPADDHGERPARRERLVHRPGRGRRATPFAAGPVDCHRQRGAGDQPADADRRRRLRGRRHDAGRAELERRSCASTPALPTIERDDVRAVTRPTAPSTVEPARHRRRHRRRGRSRGRRPGRDHWSGDARQARPPTFAISAAGAPRVTATATDALGRPSPNRSRSSSRSSRRRDRDTDGTDRRRARRRRRAAAVATDVTIDCTATDDGERSRRPGPGGVRAVDGRARRDGDRRGLHARRHRVRRRRQLRRPPDRSDRCRSTAPIRRSTSGYPTAGGTVIYQGPRPRRRRVRATPAVACCRARSAPSPPRPSVRRRCTATATDAVGNVATVDRDVPRRRTCGAASTSPSLDPPTRSTSASPA